MTDADAQTLADNNPHFVQIGTDTDIDGADAPGQSGGAAAGRPKTGAMLVFVGLLSLIRPRRA